MSAKSELQRGRLYLKEDVVPDNHSLIRLGLCHFQGDNKTGGRNNEERDAGYKELNKRWVSVPRA
jgi:hypothetical protein